MERNTMSPFFFTFLLLSNDFALRVSQSTSTVIGIISELYAKETLVWLFFKVLK